MTGKDNFPQDEKLAPRKLSRATVAVHGDFLQSRVEAIQVIWLLNIVRKGKILGRTVGDRGSYMFSLKPKKTPLESKFERHTGNT